MLERKDRGAPTCDECWLRRLNLFSDFAPDELMFVHSMKAGHRVAPAGTTMLRDGEPIRHLCTLYTGWAFRYKLLGDRRQILNILLPGDTVGLDAVLDELPYYAVEAATDVTYCVLDASRLPELFEKHPGLARRLVGIAVRERRFLDRRLTWVGRCAAEERVASFVLGLYERLRPRGLVRGNAFTLPLTQLHLADALGLNAIHVNRMLRRLRERGIVSLQDREILIEDIGQLRRAAPLHGGLTRPRPLL